MRICMEDCLVMNLFSTNHQRLSKDIIALFFEVTLFIDHNTSMGTAVRACKSRLLSLSFYNFRLHRRYLLKWSSAMPLDVLIIQEEIRHAVCFDFRQTRRNEKNGSNDAGLLIFRIKNTVSAISN